MDEDLLINLARDGDRDSMEILIRDNYPIIKGYLVKLTFNDTLADDLTQETFYKALINIRKYTHKAKVSSWLIAIATNLFRDYYRKNKKIMKTSYSYEENACIYENLESNDQDLEDNILDRMEIQKAIELLKSFPPEKRAVFVLKHFYGRSYKEISEQLDCSEGTVKSRLHYCIRALRGLMMGSEDDE